MFSNSTDYIFAGEGILRNDPIILSCFIDCLKTKTHIGETTPVGLAARLEENTSVVPETSVSRHNVVPIKGST